MSKDKDIRPTWKQVVKALKKYGVDYYPSCQVIELSNKKKHRMGLLKRKRLPAIFEYPVDYEDDERITPFVLRNICDHLKVPYDDFIFDLM